MNTSLIQSAINWRSPCVIAAARGNMQHQAGLVGRMLRELEISPCQTDCMEADCLPMGFLLELGAAIQLVQWQLDGLVDLGGMELRTMEEAAIAVSNAAFRLLDEEKEWPASPFVTTVLATWIERVAWDAPVILGANVVIGEIDEDQMVEAVAQLIWSARKKISSVDETSN